MLLHSFVEAQMKFSNTHTPKKERDKRSTGKPTQPMDILIALPFHISIEIMQNQ